MGDRHFPPFVAQVGSERWFSLLTEINIWADERHKLLLAIGLLRSFKDISLLWKVPNTISTIMATGISARDHWLLTFVYHHDTGSLIPCSHCRVHGKRIVNTGQIFLGQGYVKCTQILL